MSTAPGPTESPPPPEAAVAEGNSLGADAWRKLRRDRAAMAALALLSVVAILALVTPLLPLQPPDRVDTSLQYQEPTWSPLWLDDFHLDMEAILAAPEQVAGMRRKLEADLPAIEQAEAAYAQADAALPEHWDVRKRIKHLEAEKKVVDDAVAERYRRFGEIEDTIQRPYTEAGFARLGAVSRWMVRTRYRVFGEHQLNSLFGRDVTGRDVLSRVFWGARVSLMVGLVATMVSLLIGVTYGAVSGYLGGWVDNAMMRVVDMLYSIPFIFVVIFIITILNEERVSRRLAFWGIDRITVFYLVVGAIYWLTMARVVRGQVISLKTEPFVEAARSLGARQPRIIFRHVLPNVFSVVLVYLTLTIPRVMLFEAFLSFLGLGVQAPDVSWGTLANDGIEVISPVKVYWWLVLFPSAALGVTLLALNFLGDGLRDALDPRLRDR